jgi:hypothetical protein
MARKSTGRHAAGSWFYGSSFNGRIEPLGVAPSALAAALNTDPAEERAARAEKALRMADLLDAAGIGADLAGLMDSDVADARPGCTDPNPERADPRARPGVPRAPTVGARHVRRLWNSQMSEARRARLVARWCLRRLWRRATRRRKAVRFNRPAESTGSPK